MQEGLKKRLRISGKYKDNCVNGLLINESIWKYADVDHIINYPEFLYDIYKVLRRADVVDIWEDKSKAYVLGYRCNINDVIFDNHRNYKTKKARIYLAYKYFIYYLCLSDKNYWSPRFDNTIISLKDNISVEKEHLICCTEVHV